VAMKMTACLTELSAKFIVGANLRFFAQSRCAALKAPGEGRGSSSVIRTAMLRSRREVGLSGVPVPHGGGSGSPPYALS
jgi:hypothetical protein